MVLFGIDPKPKKTNKFITTEEAKILWQYSQRWGTKWQVMLGLALFRGMRIGEIISVNIYDFQNTEFNKLNVIFEKSHIQDQFPLLKEFNVLVRKYIAHNRHLMKDGYLFPYHSKKSPGHSHICVYVAEALFSKMRRIIGKDHHQFLDLCSDPGKSKRYRISWHSCRRWFETILWEQHKDKMLIRDLMRYKDSKTVDVYINPYTVWKNEHQIIDDTFGSLFTDFNTIAQGQTRLNSYLK